MKTAFLLGSTLLLVFSAIAAAEPPAKSEPKHGTAPGDRSDDFLLLWAQMYNGVFPEKFRDYFGRDPERTIPKESNIVVSPADGIVLLPIKSEGDKQQLTIELGWNDVHVQRMPIAGRIVSMETVGHGLYPRLDPRYWENVQVVTTIDSTLGPVVLRQITGIWTSRIRNTIKVGDQVPMGERVGRILLGSTVILTVPKRARFAVQQYDRVYAGETIIARY